MFGKKKKIEETKEYQEEKAELDKTKEETNKKVGISKETPPKEETLAEKLAKMPESEYKAIIIDAHAQTIQLLQRLIELSENEQTNN